MLLEGRTIAVASSVTLPLQPSTGVVRYIPLGGDGFTAPFAAYNVIGHSVTGAVGGGSSTLTVVMDDRYVSLVSYVSLANTQVASANADFSLLLSAQSSGMPTQSSQGVLTAIDADVNASTVRTTWAPQPVLLAGAEKRGVITGLMLNVDADVYAMSALIYLFNIRVREMSPTGLLLWARGSL